MILALISFSVLLVVGAWCMTTNTAQRFFLAANVPVIATQIRIYRARRVARLEHLTGMCEHGFPHEKPILSPPPAAVTKKANPTWEAQEPNRALVSPQSKQFGYKEYRSAARERDVWRRLADEQDERITRGMYYDAFKDSYRMWTKHKLPDGRYMVTYDDVAGRVAERLLTDEPRWDRM